MTIDAESPTAVNSAIMAAADQILAGLKVGKFFSSSLLDRTEALPISQVATSMCEATANKTQMAKNDGQRCSPTGVHQHEHSAAAMVTLNSNNDDANFTSQTSQVTIEEPNNDMTKTASASSLSSSEHSNGDLSHGDRIVDMPPLKQVTFSSGNNRNGGTKRELPPASLFAAMGEPPQQKQRLEASGITRGSEISTPRPQAQPGGEGRTSQTTWNQQHQDEKREGQIPGQLTFQPIAPAPKTVHHNRPPQPHSQELPMAAAQGQAAVPVQLQDADVSLSTKIVQNHHVSLPQGQEAASMASISCRPPVTSVSFPSKKCMSGQATVFPLAPRQGQPSQKSYKTQLERVGQGRSVSTELVPIAPAPAQSVNQGGYAEAFQIQVQPPQGPSTTNYSKPAVPEHQPIAPAPPAADQHQKSYSQLHLGKNTAQEPSVIPIAPMPPSTVTHHQDSSHHHHQQQPPPESYQKVLPPIYPRPSSALQQHEHHTPHQSQQNSSQVLDQKYVRSTHQFVFKDGMPAIPPASHIDSSSIQLDHTNYKQQSHFATLDPSAATATSAEASGPNTFTHDYSPQSCSNNGTLHEANVGASALRRPAFPALSQGGTSTDTPSFGAQGTPDVSPNLRNQRMQPTDCLLFAASLLQEVPASTSSDANKAHLYSGEHHSPAFSQVTRNTPASSPSVGASVQVPVYPSPPPSTQPPQDQPRDLDVLCGRGGLINKHIGNIIYRRVVEHNKPFYQSVQKRHRILVSQSIVHTILNRGGRFLSEDTHTTINADGTRSTVTIWKPVATARAIQKTSQALRERVANDSSKGKSSGLSSDGSVDSETKDL